MVKPNLKGLLVLEDGREFSGGLFGADVNAELIKKSVLQVNEHRDRGYGEVVFNTSLTGYQEILTDPSYYGQIICMTAAHIGNTGVNSADVESARPWCGGLVIREDSFLTSSWRSQSSLASYLRKSGVPALFGVDTRALTKHLRSKGVLRGVILPLSERSQAQALLKSLPGFEGRDLIGEVTTREPYRFDELLSKLGKDHQIFLPLQMSQSPLKKRLKVVAIDYGVKWNLLRSLAAHGCDIEVVSAKTSSQEVMSRQPDGVFLSNGPGDPEAAPYATETVKNLIGKIPLFGVCMGHQILALALGGRTYKLKFGHRGGNQPVLDRSLGRVEISSHNHGYSVDGASLPSGVNVTHHNLNDKTVEGLSVPSARAFSVQYHPESCPGPHDSNHLFERFVQSMQSSG